jgi:hypothetical protein
MTLRRVLLTRIKWCPPYNYSGCEKKMVKNATFEVLAEDLIVSFRFAAKNIITFILGLIGVVLVTGLTFIIGVLIIFIPILIFVGFGPMTEFFISLGPFFDAMNPAMMGMMFVLIMPILLPLFVAVGALFGMGREIVESSGASAEGVLTWYRRKFFPLASGGVILFTITLLPIGLMYATIFTLTRNPLTGPFNGIVSAISIVWIVVSLGFLSMTFPAIIDGVPVLEAVKQSIRMSWDYFDRVFSVWISFILIFVGPFIPIIAIPLTMTTTSFAFSPIVLGVMTVAAILFIIILLLAVPAFVISLSRMYMILSGIELSPPEDQEPAISMVGGF